MTHGTLIVLEGIDGSGKATQSALLEKKLKEAGKDVMHISFPDYASDSSALVKMYLKGDFGADPGDVNPYAASLFYAVDRFASYRMKWKDFYEKGGIIIADRYTTSNMVHQMTQYDDEEERTQFLDLPGRYPLRHSLGPHERVGSDIALTQFVNAERTLLYVVDDNEILHILYCLYINKWYF